MTDPYIHDHTPWRDRETLRELYVDQNMNNTEIAEELGTSQPTVSKWLDKYGIKTIDRINKDRPWKNEDLLRELYEEEMLSVDEIADKLDCGHVTVLEWMDKHGIERRDRIEAAVRANRRKPPCHRFTKDGYEVVETQTSESLKQIRIHRLVAISEYGADAVAGNVVHHKNGMPSDNRPDNLQVMSAEEHAREHKPVQVRWGNRDPIESHVVGDRDA